MLTVEEITRFISDDESDPKKQRAKEGLRYYEGEHDIRNYKLYYYNADGKIVEDKSRSNMKISHPFFTELVDQCVQYMLSGDESFVKSNNAELQAELDLYFGDEFRSELADTLTDTCAGGFGYMYGYMNSDMRTSFTYAEQSGVVEVRAKDTDDHTEYVIYWYIDRIDKGKKKVKRIQVWDSKQTTYFCQVDNGKVEKDTSVELNPRPHILYTKKDGTYYDGFGFIPFFRLDANKKQTSHLKPVKEIIDDYDLMSCGLSNNIQDVSEAVWVVKGFQGDNLEEMIQNVKTKKHIGVEPDGDVDIKTISIPYEARKIKMETDEKNIYRFGMGFNSAQLGDGNVTNVVIKSRYALLDLKCNKLEARLKAFLRKLVKIALNEINKIKGTDYQPKDVYFEFNREVMTNATDNATIEFTKAQAGQVRMTTLLNAASLLDEETVLKAICEILEIDYEEVKDKIPKQPATDLNEASEKLANVVPQEGGDDGGGGEGV